MSAFSNLPTIDQLRKVHPFFKFITEGNPIAEKAFFKDLRVNQNKSKSLSKLELDIVLHRKISFEIPGTGGIIISLNSKDQETVFEMNINLKWKVLDYVPDFSLATFGDTGRQAFDFALKLFNFKDDDLLRNILSKLLASESDANALIGQVNDFGNGAFQIDLLQDPSSWEDAIDAIMSAKDSANIDLLEFVFQYFINADSFENIIDNLKSYLLKPEFEFDYKHLLELLYPEIMISLDTVSFGVEFPRKYLQPVFTNFTDYPNANPQTQIGDILPDPYLSKIEIDYNTVILTDLKSFEFDQPDNIRFYKSKIGNTNFTISANGVKLDLSRTTNIPEATADGRPEDFIGVYITEGSIGFPTDWGHNSPDIPPSTAELFVSNLLVGTGGISGTIGMRPTNPNDEDGLIQLKFGDKFKVSLSDFEIVFQQNAIISSAIHGKLEIPGFKNEAGQQVIIDIDIHIGQNGEFNIVAAALPQIKKISVPNAFDFDIKSAFFGREAGSDGRFYLGVSGMLDIKPPAPLSSLLPDKLDIKKMLIYDDGKFEFEGGKIPLPKAYTVNFGAATVSVTGIHSGNYEKDGRDYKYFGFDGGVSTKPSCVDAQGKGIKFYYTTDESDFDWFIRLESLKVDIIIPGGAKPEDAAVTIKGFLSIGEPRIPEGATPEMIELLKSAQEYIGGVDVRIPKFRGLQASAAMRLTPKVPAFIIDLGLEMSTPILLGATGLGIYGFRALFGKRYVASKGAANIPDTGEWWQYYKAKIEPDYKVGIQVSKFDIKEGFSVGAGVSLATASDSGKIFSSKLFFLLSLPDVFLFQGQAQFLKERISLDTNPDPPFFAIIAITNHSVEAGFGVNYKLRDDGKIVTVDGVIELGFFWGSSSSWYINVGRETPEDRRIQARLFDILNMYFYLMISSNGLRLGAGVKFEWAKKFGPLSAELKAYIDTFGKISKRPRQIGGAIKLGGTVGIKICGLGFSVSGSATLAAEAPKPHVVTGEFEVCVKVLKKERCARFEFTWFFNDELELIPTSLIGANVGESTDRDMNDVQNAARMTNMVTGETYPLKHTSTNPIPAPDSWITGGADDYRVPMDSFFDIEFKKGMNMTPAVGNNLGKIGGISTPAQYMEFVPPLRGKSDRVRHEYFLKDIDIFYWDENADPVPAWAPYNFYNALLPMYEHATGTLVDAIDADALSNAKWGYWQQQAPGLNNKLRILATSPISYTSTTGNAYNIEDLGINGSTIFCPGDPIDHTCVTFSSKEEQRIFAADTLNSYQNVIFRVTQADGTVMTMDGSLYGLQFEPGSMLEIFFHEPMKDVHLDFLSGATQLTLDFYQRQEGPVVNNLSTYTYVQVGTKQHDPTDGILEYTQLNGAFDKIEVTMTGCQKPGTINIPTSKQTKILYEMQVFLNTLISNGQLTDPSVELYDQYASDYQNFFASTLYPYSVNPGDQVMLTQGYVSNSGLSFTISDNKGYSCQYNFLLTQAVTGFTFDAITGVFSIVPDPTSVLGEQQAMIVTFDALDKNRVKYRITCRLTTCHVLSYLIDSCSTGLYELCYLSLENYLLNETIPTEIEQTAANDAMFDAINKTLQPIWRPNTAYAIRLKTEDRLFREGQSDVAASQVNTDIFGFRTAGPVGHFHSYPVLDTTGVKRKDRSDYEKLDLVGKQDEFRLSSLKSYIDYDKSYPNADGSLVNAKPLFYKDAELRLFYLYNYVYHFYNDWADYDHLLETGVAKVAGSSLEIKVIDPAPAANAPDQPDAIFDANMIVRNSSVGQPPVLINSVNNDISLLNNLLTGGNPCADTVPLTPIDISSVKNVDLKPLKLYTAQFVANYNARLNGALSSTPFSSVVHSYVFQTSRYGRFEEQVNSYILSAPGVVPVKKAIYPLELPVVPDYELAEQVLSDTLTTTQDLMKQQYANTFDRLVQGVFALDANALQTAPTTEFNLLHSQGLLRGILIRNPEPFNNPKLPTAHTTLEVRTFNGTAFVNPEAFHVLHSADRASIFITPADMSFEINPNAFLEFRFKYKTYDGIQYQDAAEVTVEINLTNHPF
jgi:hypothetical protein